MFTIKLYTKYKQRVKNPVVKYHDFKKLTEEYVRFLIDKILENKTVTLPCRLGSLSIIGKKVEYTVGEDGSIKGLSPDWGSTIALWNKSPEAKKNRKMVWLTNSHSDGIRYKYFWSKKRVLISNKTFYSLRMTKENKRKLSRSIINDNKTFSVK